MHAFSGQMTTSTRSRCSSASSVKRLLSLTALFTICSITIGSVILPGALSLSAKAYDLPTGTTHISSDTLVSWLGNTLPAQYVGTDLQYHATTARRVQTTESIVSSDMDGYTSNLYNGRTMAWYVVDIPSADVFTAFAYAPIATIDFNLHFQNVTYADFGFADYVSNKYMNVSYATCQPYCYLDYNYQGQYSKLYNPPASGTYAGHLGTFGTAFSPSYGTHYGGGIVQLSGSASDLYIGTVSACCLGNFDGGLLVGISLLDIVLNSDYVLATSAPPPQGGSSGGGDTPSGSSSGKVTGTIGEQNVNIDVDVTQEFPDWMYSADVTDYDDDGFAESVTSLGSVDVEGMASGVSSLGTYDAGILWYALEQLFGQHTEIVLLLSGCGALCLFGFVLNRFGR